MANLLFDVVLVDANNEPIMVHERGVPMTEAIQLSTIWNADPDNRPVAVVVMAGTVQCPIGATEIDSDALDEQDDSVIESGTKNAAEANVANSLWAKVQKKRYDFVAGQYRKHLCRLMAGAPHVCDSGDIGIVCNSLRTLAMAIDDNEDWSDIDDWAFNNGYSGNWRNDELEAVLGLEVASK